MNLMGHDEQARRVAPSDQHARLLIAHDGTGGADKAVEYAAQLFSTASATIVHVSKSLIDWGIAPRIKMPDNDLFDTWVLEAAEARLDAAVEVARTQGLDATGILRTSARNACQTILEVADQLDLDLMLVGKHAPGRLGGFRLGSVAQGLAAQSTLPVVVVPPSAIVDAAEDPGPIIIGFDASEGAHAVLNVVARLLPGSSVVIASVWEPLPAWVLSPPPSGHGWSEAFDDEAQMVADSQARDGVELAHALGLVAEPQVLTGIDGVAQQLEALAETRRARLLCVGSQARGRFQATSLGSVAHAVVADASLPVLLAHPNAHGQTTA